MLEELLHLLQDGNSHNVQELADLLHEDTDDIIRKLEYLEQQGYIKKVSLTGNCNHHCIGCHGCDQVNPRLTMWEVINR